MAVVFNDNVYLFEFKVMELANEGAAMAQLRSRGYADKYRHLDQPIHLIAVEFSKGNAQRGGLRGGAGIAFGRAAPGHVTSSRTARGRQTRNPASQR